ncbi:unnamed protein product, partial [marine sediment metagenome]
MAPELELLIKGLMKFKKSLLNIVQKENGQMALILAFVFLAVLGTIGISFLYRMRLEDR